LTRLLDNLLKLEHLAAAGFEKTKQMN